ncbi:MAG TPA: DUF6503 family protein [Phaeodactylibacter sp.]|nr:DUF6503 family protein [Phaeodactylibacter sp.]
MRTIIIASLLALLWSCSAEPPSEGAEAANPKDAAASVIQQALQAHGSTLLDSSTVQFRFRKYAYEAERQGGQYRYTRTFVSEDGDTIRDQLTNDALRRSINGEPVELSAKDSAAYAGSVNSVVYFALLPYFLQDPAVQTEYLGETTIKGEAYDKIKVVFRQEGGGTDYEDEYVYWFHRGRHTMDYLAYNYQVNGGGARFREAYNVRNINGLRIADYRNYKPKGDSRAVATFDSLFEAGSLEQVSLIETENVSLRQ